MIPRFIQVSATSNLRAQCNGNSPCLKCVANNNGICKFVKRERQDHGKDPYRPTSKRYADELIKVWQLLYGKQTMQGVSMNEIVHLVMEYITLAEKDVVISSNTNFNTDVDWWVVTVSIRNWSGELGWHLL
jgi:hypothetical protein